MSSGFLFPIFFTGDRTMWHWSPEVEYILLKTGEVECVGSASKLSVKGDDMITDWWYLNVAC